MAAACSGIPVAYQWRSSRWLALLHSLFHLSDGRRRPGGASGHCGCAGQSEVRQAAAAQISWPSAACAKCAAAADKVETGRGGAWRGGVVMRAGVTSLDLDSSRTSPACCWVDAALSPRPAWECRSCPGGPLSGCERVRCRCVSAMMWSTAAASRLLPRRCAERQRRRDLILESFVTELRPGCMPRGSTRRPLLRCT